MRHRGPDAEGIYLDANVGLGHVRLSIIDLDAGSQPMCNEDATIWIAFNGEIYNYLELRTQLCAYGHKFKTHSDTEVIVHLYEQFGIDCLRHLRGMFAFVIWDSNAKELLVARDRVGIKPLYYFIGRESVILCSEILPIIRFCNANLAISEDAAKAFWAQRFLPGESTMHSQIKRVIPGSMLRVSAEGKVRTSQYWDLPIARSGRHRNLVSAADELEQLFRESVRLHMRSDVPVGFLLSGGLDSSAVLAAASQCAPQRMSTFTVGFSDSDCPDERPFARIMAKRCGSNHYETTFSAEDFWNYLPSLFRHLEEPVSEPPAVALHFVSQLARSHVKVLLSGEGGDEAFGGYPEYPKQLFLARLRRILGPLRKPAAISISAIASALGLDRVQIYSEMLSSHVARYYWSRVGLPYRPTSFVHSALSDHPDGLSAYYLELFDRVSDRPLLDQLLYVDIKTWLPDDLLIKADKITMASSLELRVPLLDHQLLEFSAGLPQRFKVDGFKTKCVFRSALRNILPPQILTRKKAGFPVPYERWFSTNLWENVREMLTDRNAFVLDIFPKRFVLQLLDGQRAGKHHAYDLFSLLALEFWAKEIHRAPSARCV